MFLKLLIKNFIPFILISFLLESGCTESKLKCELQNLEGCWWFLYQDKYWEACFSKEQFDLFQEAIHLVSGTNYNLDQENCYLIFYKYERSIGSFRIEDFTKKEMILLERKSQKRITASKIIDQKYTQEIIIQDSLFYDNYSEAFHNRMMDNKYK